MSVPVWRENRDEKYSSLVTFPITHSWPSRHDEIKISHFMGNSISSRQLTHSWVIGNVTREEFYFSLFDKEKSHPYFSPDWDWSSDKVLHVQYSPWLDFSG